jgi:hypothetical protein
MAPSKDGMPRRVGIRCPNCQRELKARAEHVGRRVRCRDCRHAFRADAEAGGGPEPPAPVAPPPSRRKIVVPCPGCRRELRIGVRHVGVDVRCKHCSHLFRVRQEEGHVAPPRNSRPAASERRAAPRAVSPHQEAAPPVEVGPVGTTQGKKGAERAELVRTLFEVQDRVARLLEERTREGPKPPDPSGARPRPTRRRAEGPRDGSAATVDGAGEPARERERLRRELAKARAALDEAAARATALEAVRRAYKTSCRHWDDERAALKERQRDELRRLTAEAAKKLRAEQSRFEAERRQSDEQRDRLRAEGERLLTEVESLRRERDALAARAKEHDALSARSQTARPQDKSPAAGAGGEEAIREVRLELERLRLEIETERREHEQAIAALRTGMDAERSSWRGRLAEVRGGLERDRQSFRETVERLGHEVDSLRRKEREAHRGLETLNQERDRLLERLGLAERSAGDVGRHHDDETAQLNGLLAEARRQQGALGRRNDELSGQLRDLQAELDRQRRGHEAERQEHEQALAAQRRELEAAPRGAKAKRGSKKGGGGVSTQSETGPKAPPDGMALECRDLVLSQWGAAGGGLSDAFLEAARDVGPAAPPRRVKLALKRRKAEPGPDDQGTSPDPQALKSEIDRLGEELGRLYGQGLLREATATARRVADLSRTLVGPRHPDYAVSLNKLGSLLFHQGDLGAAEPLFQEAEGICREALGEHDPLYAVCLNNEAMLLQARGDHARALPIFERAVSILEGALGRQHPLYTSLANNLATLKQKC